MGRWAKVKLAFKRISLSITKAYSKLTAYKPSAFVMALVGAAVAIMLFGGFLYDITAKPAVALPRPGAIWVAYPLTLLEQFLIESIEAMVFFALGFAGLLLIYESTKYADDPYRAAVRFVIGVVLLLGAFFACRYLLTLKTRPAGL